MKKVLSLFQLKKTIKMKFVETIEEAIKHANHELGTKDHRILTVSFGNVLLFESNYNDSVAEVTVEGNYNFVKDGNTFLVEEVGFGLADWHRINIKNEAEFTDVRELCKKMGYKCATVFEHGHYQIIDQGCFTKPLATPSGCRIIQASEFLEHYDYVLKKRYTNDDKEFYRETYLAILNRGNTNDQAHNVAVNSVNDYLKFKGE